MNKFKSALAATGVTLVVTGFGVGVFWLAYNISVWFAWLPGVVLMWFFVYGSVRKGDDE